MKRISCLLVIVLASSCVTANDISPRVDINGVVDSALASVRALVKELDLDPVVLPGDKGDFIVTLFNRVLSGEVYLGNARVGGLSTIHRTGDCTLITQVVPPTATADVSVGGNNIDFGFDIGWGAGILKTNLKVDLFVQHVSLTLGVGVNLKNNATTLTNFILNEIGRVQFKIDGIPGGGGAQISNRLTLVSNLVKDSLIYAFQEALRPIIEGLVNRPGLFQFFIEQVYEGASDLIHHV